MLNSIYNLPELNFVGGESRQFFFNLFARGSRYYDATGCEVCLSILNYSNKNSDPEVVRTATIKTNGVGINCVAEVNLLPEDTVNLYGKYVYQISIKDPDNEVEIPGQGIMMINRNIHKGFVVG